MVQKVYSVKDVLAEAFGPPVLARTDLAAQRSYLRMVTESKLDQKEYVLYHIGYFDDAMGLITSSEVPRIVDEPIKKDADLTEVM